MDEEEFQLDLTCAIARIEQAGRDPEMMEFLVHRLATCDAPRLRRYLTAEWVARLDDALSVIPNSDLPVQ